MKVDLPLRGSGHPNAFGKRGGESLPNGGDLPIACDHDVHAVDESRTGKRLLRSEEIHHDEVPTVHTPDAFGFDQTSHPDLGPAAISSAARPAIVSTTSTNANSTARFTTSMAHTSATPDASAMRVRARRPT